MSTNEFKVDFGHAYKIATELEAMNIGGPRSTGILAMALGIYVEGQEGSHRNMEPLAEALLHAAQLAFDALRRGRQSGKEPSA